MSHLQIQEGALAQGGVTAASGGAQGANYQQAVSESILQVLIKFYLKVES